MKQYKLTKDQINKIADYFAKQDRNSYGSGENDKRVLGYLEIYNETREELEKYNSTFNE